MALVLGRTEPPTDHGNGRNADSLLLTGYGAANRRSCMYWPTATARNPPGGKSKPSSLSLFDWALTLEQEPVGAGR